MGKLDLKLELEVASKEEADLVSISQHDTIGKETRSSVLSKVHRFVKGLIIPLDRVDPLPPKECIDDADYIPEMTAGWFSLLTFGWMNGLMTLGYTRPLEASDLWKLQEHRSSEVIANAILSSFGARYRTVEEYNTRLAKGKIKPPLRLRLLSALWGHGEEWFKQWVEKDGRKQPSLTLAINDSIKWWFWSGGILKVAGDTAQVTSPLVLKSLIKFATDSYVSRREGLPAPHVGRGITLAFTLVILQILGLLCQHHFFHRSTSSGVLVRGGLITAIYLRSLRLTSGARARLSNGRLANYISTDVTRIDFCCGCFHISWTAPIQLGICLGLLFSNLDPSALAGFAIWLAFHISYVRTILLVRAANVALVACTPAMASVVAFLAYAGSGHQLTPAVIFSSLAWFQAPYDATRAECDWSSTGMLHSRSHFCNTYARPKLKYTVEIDNASFTWDGPPPDLDESREVESGKTSLLQGLIGDMRRSEGSVRVGGSVAYCPQSAWIQNATIRDNVCFGRLFEEGRYWKAIHDTCLEPDLDVLPNGDITEGISLSGGQKQRVNICRAIYSRSDILIFDDPLSALDAHVGEYVPNNVILDCSSGATRILVTHALRCLPKVDHIYFVVNGRVTEHGAFDELMANREEFARTFDEVTKDQTESEGEKAVDVEDANENIKKRRAAKRSAQFMQAEERNTGAVNVQVYKQYILSGNGMVQVPVMSVVARTLWLIVTIAYLVLRYRPELPLVLKGLSMSVEGRKKIGIVGRTGAGKSSIMVALFRIVELQSGSISIDGVDISNLGFNDVRFPALYAELISIDLRNLRSNLDPFGQHDDIRLWDALRRSYLVEDTKPISPVISNAEGEGEQLGTRSTTPNAARFTLDSPIEEEGLSASVPSCHSHVRWLKIARSSFWTRPPRLLTRDGS
ncbi:P-loop containing nucleoside triphosphate hydrolase protein [Lactarius akahatsu]|uniref:P-loop containing nucleoside triphosphate hydrolase protein n=1 Tax=Lactarius akahatsu TaxID=416441 RepID=A0AAD4LC69_9AGAM|nr:P-loop containing nucleoside triphosphate hydrolase protein [Lactarius akahatsu]